MLTCFAKLAVFVVAAEHHRCILTCLRLRPFNLAVLLVHLRTMQMWETAPFCCLHLRWNYSSEHK